MVVLCICALGSPWDGSGLQLYHVQFGDHLFSFSSAGVVPPLLNYQTGCDAIIADLCTHTTQPHPAFYELWVSQVTPVSLLCDAWSPHHTYTTTNSQVAAYHMASVLACELLICWGMWLAHASSSVVRQLD